MIKHKNRGTDIHQTLRYKKFCLNQSINKSYLSGTKDFLYIINNDLYNGSILYIKSYKRDTFSDIVYSSLSSKLFSR